MHSSGPTLKKKQQKTNQQALCSRDFLKLFQDLFHLLHLSRWLLSQSAGAEEVPSQPTFLRKCLPRFLVSFVLQIYRGKLLLPKATSFSAFPTGAISVYLTTICLDQSSWESTRELRNASRKCLTANTCLTKYSLLILHFSYQWLAHPSQVSVNIQGRQLRGKN